MIETITKCDQCGYELPRKGKRAFKKGQEQRFYSKPFSLILIKESSFVFSVFGKKDMQSTEKRYDFCSYNCFDKYLEESIG